MIKISHEVPLCLLKESRRFNDYDYALPHLLDENKEYRNFFLESKKLRRTIYLDNSVHELLTPYDHNRLLFWLGELKPKIFFIPDYLEDKTQSIISAKRWIPIQPNFSKITFTAVVQGKTYGEMMECYQTYKDLGYQKIAFNYGSSFYNKISNHPNKDIGKALGRIQVISQLIRDQIINKSDSIHLLGCSSPFEFSLYKGIKNIDSIDTSNPIMLGLDGVKYNNSLVMNKPTSNLNNNFNINIKDIDVDKILYNIEFFRNYLK